MATSAGCVNKIRNYIASIWECNHKFFLGAETDVPSEGRIVGELEAVAGHEGNVCLYSWGGKSK